MKASHRHVLTIVGALSALAGSGVVSVAAAQGKMPDVPRIMVPTFTSNEQGLGAKLADELRERLKADVPIRQLWTIPSTDIKNALVSSGFPPDQPLNPADLKELAKIIRADEVVTGRITRTPNGVHVVARYGLARDLALSQPLPVIDRKNEGDAARALVGPIKDARRQLGAYKKCEDALRNDQYAQALAAAREGAGNPQATLLNLCGLSAYAAMKAPNDTVVKYADQILSVDPDNRIALGIAAEAYKAMSQAAQAKDTTVANRYEDKAIAYWVRLLQTDPTNVKLQTQVVAELARSGNPQVALPIIDQAVQQNPDELSLLRMQWLIHLAAHDYKGGVAMGEKYVALDTAQADAAYFTRQVAALVADSQPQRAAEMAAKGFQKFPSNGEIALTYATTLKQAGQLQQAADIFRRALAANPKLEHGYVQVAQLQVDMNQPDSALATLHQAVASQNDSAAYVGAYALTTGNAFYKKAVASKAMEDYQTAMRFLAYSDSLAPSPQAKFLLGVSAFSVGQMAATQAPKAGSKAQKCELAQTAQSAFSTAQVSIPAGGSVAPDAAKQYMGYLGQFVPVVQNQVKVFCK